MDLTATDPRAVVVCDLGRIAYEPAWALQRRLQARLVAAKRATPPERVPHLLLLVEHPPVYTLGKNGDADHLLLPEDDLARRGATFVHIDRGGDITYHGPGQLVGYPILDLDRFFTDLGRYLRALEQVMIDACADYGLDARRSEAGTGVWIGPDERGGERKICAFGIRCSRWVTMHGFAFNVDPDLSYFGHIVPCGIRNKGVTSLTAELGRPVDAVEARRRVVGHFARVFDARIVETHTGNEARAYLERFAAAPADVSP